MTSVVIHYQEIALKGRNRPWFIGRLVRNLRNITADLGVREVRPLMGRIEIVLGPDTSWETVRERLVHTFGIANFSRAGRVPLDLGVVADAILADLRDVDTESFRVAARRSDKRFPVPSPDIEREVGGRIKLARGWHVDLEQPKLIVHVETLADEAFYFFGKHQGPGGLPTGVSGRVVCLMSGGIDSPVAAHRLMKRGCRVIFVHFHSYPFLSHASQEKVRELVTRLTRFQQHSRLYLVAFGEVQRQVTLAVPPALRVVVYRRLMFQIAERIARKLGAQALGTGEVIGQVASQTLENMSVIDRAASLPVFRPLIGMDKEEIAQEAQRLGTYPISIIPDQDCCQLFTPRHPATRARFEEVREVETGLPIADWVREAADAAAVEEFRFPVLKYAVPQGS